jgi:hypothetical protein
MTENRRRLGRRLGDMGRRLGDEEIRGHDTYPRSFCYVNFHHGTTGPDDGWWSSAPGNAA